MDVPERRWWCAQRRSSIRKRDYPKFPVSKNSSMLVIKWLDAAA